MERDNFIPIALFLTVLAFLPKMECQLRPRPIPLPQPLPPPRPLCASQLSLVNYACALLPFSPAPPVTPPPPPPPPPHHPPPKHPHHGGDHEDENDNNDDDELEHHHDHEHGHRHGHGHRHRHRHRHRHSSQEENCCHWLKNVDSECVCDLLVHLPVFLAKPVHEYTVVVDDTCSVTYACNGRLRP